MTRRPEPLDVEPRESGVASIDLHGMMPVCAVCGGRLASWRDNDSFAWDDPRSWVYTHTPGGCAAREREEGEK